MRILEPCSSALGPSQSNQKGKLDLLLTNSSKLVKVNTVDVGQHVGETSLRTDRMGGFDSRPFQ
jgi:hypothetical protein